MYKEDLVEIGREALSIIYAHLNKFVNFGGGEPIPNMFTNRTGRLYRSLAGTSDSSIKEVYINDYALILEVGSREPYALITEIGGIRVVTDKMKRFFWYMHYNDKHEKWKRMALSKTLKFPERPALAPAIEESLPKVKNYIVERIKKQVEASFRQILEDR